MDFNTWFQPLKDMLAVDSDKFKKLQKLWLRAYAYFGEVLTSPRLEMYADDCMDLAVHDVEVALDTFRSTPPPEGHKPRAPMPVDVRSLINVRLAPDAHANAIAASIFAAIGLYGRPHQSKAEQYLGELAWQVVERMGGWTVLCETAEPKRRDAFHAQVRDVALMVLQTQQFETMDVLRELAARRQQDCGDALESRPHRPGVASRMSEAPAFLDLDRRGK